MTKNLVFQNIPGKGNTSFVDERFMFFDEEQKAITEKDLLCFDEIDKNPWTQDLTDIEWLKKVDKKGIEKYGLEEYLFGVFKPEETVLPINKEPNWLKMRANVLPSYDKYTGAKNTFTWIP